MPRRGMHSKGTQTTSTRSIGIQTVARNPGRAIVKTVKKVKDNQKAILKMQTFLNSLIQYSTWYKTSSATLSGAKLNLVPIVLPSTGGGYSGWSTCFQNDTSEVGVSKTCKLNSLSIRMTCESDNNTPPATWNVMIIKAKYKNTLDAGTTAPLVATDISSPQDYVGEDKIMMNRKRWSVLAHKTFVLGHMDSSAQGGTINNIVTNFRDLRRDVQFRVKPYKMYLHSQDGGSWQDLTAATVPRHQQIYLVWYVNKGITEPDNNVAVRYTVMAGVSEKS